ncbi:aminodeoxychorismate lyase, partial [Neisseria arctica]
GTYRLPKQISARQILQRQRDGHPDTITIRITKGMRFSQMRNIITNTADLKHDTQGWRDEKLLKEIDPSPLSNNPAGLF